MRQAQTPRFAVPSGAARPLWAVRPEDIDATASARSAEVAAWIGASGFAAAPGEVLLLPGPDGVSGALCGLGNAAGDARRRFTLGAAQSHLPGGDWYLATELERDDRSEAGLGWLLAEYRFSRYSGGDRPAARLVAPDGLDAARTERIAAAEYLTRDLINTPASDMGPDQLQAAVAAMADEFGASLAVTKGAALLDANLPLIHTVGRASDKTPRLLDLNWGDAGARLTLVGKGVCLEVVAGIRTSS